MGQRTYRFKKGERPHLDEVCHLLGLLPLDCYYQDDIADSNSHDEDNDNDAGESILFLKNVTVVTKVTVT